MADLPDDTSLKEAVVHILRTNDLEKITLRIVMSMLCTRFSLEAHLLAPKKRAVRGYINEYLENSYDPAEASDDEHEAVSNGSDKQRKASSSSGALNKPVRLSGLERAVVLSEPLASFLGEDVMPRSHIPRKITAYAKQHNLQDPNDRRNILCDDALKAAMGVDHFTFFQMAKIITGLVQKPEDVSDAMVERAKQCEQLALQEKQRKKAEDVANGVTPKQKKASKAATKVAKSRISKPVSKKVSGLMKPMKLSPELSAVCGSSQLARSEVTQKIWAYIRENELKDPNDKTRIICDSKLKAVFDGNLSVANMAINKFLSAHMSKIEPVE